MKLFIVALAFALLVVTDSHAATDTPTVTPTPTITRTPSKTPTPLVDFFTGFEFGEGLESFFQGDAAGGTTLAGGSSFATVVSGIGYDSFDDWQYTCTTSGVSTCSVYHTFSATPNVSTFGWFKVDQAPAVEGPFVQFSNGLNIAGFLNISQNPAGTGYILSAYYGNDNPECGSSNNDGTTCLAPNGNWTPTPTPGVSTPAATPRCKPADAGESSCTSGAYDVSGTLGYGRYYYLSFSEMNTWEEVPGAVRLEALLWDNTGTRVWSAGTTRRQGQCTLGTGDHPAFACYQDSDCGTSGTCGLSTIVSPSKVSWGMLGGVGNLIFSLGGFGTQTNIVSATKRARIETIYPAGVGAVANGMTSGGGTVGCAGQTWWGCIDDLASGAPDDNATYAAATSANAQRSFTTGGIAALATGEGILSISASQVGRQVGTASGVKTISSCIYNNSTQDCGTAVDWFSFGDTNYHASSYVIRAAPVGTPNPSATPGQLWSRPQLNLVELEINRPTGSSGDTRTTAMVGEVLIAQDTSVTIGGTLSDKNGDGHINVCWAGDSRLYYDEFTNQLSSLVNQPDVLTKCARGGATTLNGYRILDGMLTGAPNSTTGCVTKRGIPGTPCDYLFVDYGINDWAFGSGGGLATGMYKDEGYCWDNGGANQGNACNCELDFINPYIIEPVWDPDDVNHFYDIQFCTRGADFGLAPGLSTCTGQPAASYSCDFTTSDSVRWNQFGCKKAAGCPTGVCVKKNSISNWERLMTQYIDKVHASSAHTKIIYVLPWDGFNNTGIANPVCWGKFNTELSAIRQFYKERAEQYNDNWIDVRSEFIRMCHPWQNCIIPSDGIHPSTAGVGTDPSGNVVLARLAAACLTQDPSYVNKSCNNL